MGMNKVGRYLSTRLLLTLVIITTLVMALFLSIRTYRTYVELEEGLNDHAEVIASRVANAVRPAIWNLYQKSTNRQFSEGLTSAILKAEFLDDDVNAVRVYGNFGHLFSGMIRNKQGEIIPYSEAVNHLLHDPFLVIRKPIMHSKLTIGNVEVTLNNTKFEKRFMSGLLLELLQMAVVSALIVALVYRVLQTSMVKPLREIQIAKSALEVLGEGVMILNDKGKLIGANPKFLNLFKLKDQHVINKRFYLSSIIDRSDTNAEQIIDTVITTGSWSGELQAKMSDGRVFPAWIEGKTITGEKGKLVASVFVIRDMTDLKMNQAEVEHMAYHDALTSLPNRTNFERQLKHDIALADRMNTNLGVLFIDLDDFKSVNDTLGHKMGDELLTIITNRFEGYLRDSDTLARLGGDEFTVILSGEREEYKRVADALIDLARQPVELSGHEIYVGASVGIAVYPVDGTDTNDLLKHADVAMYRSKDLGRNRTSYYSTELDNESEKRLALESELRYALDKDQFELHYQPKVDFKTRKVVGFEGLIRWRKDDYTLVPPFEFIPFAEARGLIIPIGRQVIQKAAKQLRTWKDQHSFEFSIAINLSPVQFYDQGLIDILRSVLKEYNLTTNDLELEITESTLIQDIEHSISLLKELKSLGFRVSIDDFGTGYSSLSYLKRLPIDCLKIDRSFILDIEQSKSDMAIAQAIKDLATSLDLDVIVEGIEEEVQITLLTEMGCTVGQGYLFSRPLPANEIISYIESTK